MAELHQIVKAMGDSGVAVYTELNIIVFVCPVEL